MIYIGVDGGGTKTALAAFRDGALISSARSGALNYNFIGVEQAVAHLIEGVRALQLPADEIAAIGIGDPSIDDGVPSDADSPTTQFAQAVEDALRCPVYIRSDAYMTLFGLTGGSKTAVLMLSGTGAMGIAENDEGKIMVAGGWGRLTGDEGSGYYIALEGIKAALHAADGIAPYTSLTDAALCHFGVSSPRALTAVFYAEPTSDIAAFATAVAACAEAGDATAKQILSDAARYLAAYTARLVQWSDAQLVGVYGSVICQNRTVREEYEKVLKAQFPALTITEPSVAPEHAAALYAIRQRNQENKK